MTEDRHNAGADDAPAYAAAAMRQRDLLQSLDALSRRQALLIDEPELDPLLRVLNERQQVIDELLDVRAASEAFEAGWAAAPLSEQSRDDVRGALLAVSTLAEQVAARDEQDHARLKRRLDGVTSELAGLAAGLRAGSAYGGRVGVRPDGAALYQDRNA